MPPKKKQEASKKTIDKAKERIIEVLRSIVISSCFVYSFEFLGPILIFKETC